MKRRHLLHIAITLCLLLAAGAICAQEFEVQVKDLGGGLAWHTTFEYGTSNLVITGPKKYDFIRDFGRDEVVWDAAKAADGLYRWELSMRNELPGSVVEGLKQARANNDESYACELMDQGVIQAQSFSGSFFVIGGDIVLPSDEEEEPRGKGRAASGSVLDTAGALAETRVPTKQVISGDLTVYNSLCVGFDCLASESYGADTIRLKENNLRIHFDDTSTAGSYPDRDWRIVVNDQANGGLERFTVEDVTAGRYPFTIEGGARGNALYVDSGGRVGLGTSSPVVDLHVKDGDTPTLRLEQDTSSGFAAQTWDIAGNETSFFVRDASNGSTLPFRIRPGAPSQALVIDADGDVGIGTLTSDVALHVKQTDAQLLVEATNSSAGARTLMELRNSGQVNFLLSRTDGGSGNWSFAHNGPTFDITKIGTGFNEFSLNENGNLTIRGSLIAQGGDGMTDPGDTFPDYVFEEGYELRTLDDLAAFIAENGHLPNVTSREEVRRLGGIDMTKLQLETLEKVEELTLYTLAQEETIRRLEARLAELEGGGQGE